MMDIAMFDGMAISSEITKGFSSVSKNEEKLYK